MKRHKLTNITKIYIIPLLSTVLITILVGYVLYNNTNKKYHDIYIDSTKSYSKVYVDKIIDNKETETTLKNSIFNKLLNVAIISLGDEENITNEYLLNLANEHEVNNIVYFDMEGNPIYHTIENLQEYKMEEDHTIYKFINSDDKQLFEDIRKSYNFDTYNMYVYLRSEDNNHFVQVSISAEDVYDLTNKYNHQNSLNDIISINDQVLDSFIINKSGKITTKDKEVDSHPINKREYLKVFDGETFVREINSTHLNKMVLEISMPIEIDGNIDEVITIFYSLDFYNIISRQVLVTMFILSLLIILTSSISIFIFLIRPLNSLEKSLSSLDASLGTYTKPKKEHGVFKEVFKSLEELSLHIKDVNMQNRKLNESIYELALTDYLTNLPNRMKLVDTINSYMRESRSFALIFLDIDNFKTYNDTKGHLFGDRLLIEVVKRLGTIKKNDSFISRYGGDEFIILFKYKDDSQIKKYIKEIYKLFKEPINLNNELNIVDISVGISKYPFDAKTSSELIRKADIAMYHGKTLSKNTYVFYDDYLDKNLEEELYIKSKLEEALLNDGFKIVLQPQVDILNDEIISYEALARFKDIDIGPYKFISVAEKYGLINDLGKVIIKKVVETLNEFKEKNIKLKTIYANFSILELNDKTLINFILNELKKYDIDPIYFGIEITEGVLIENEENSIKFFNKLKQYGFKLAIDDFGSGNASLSYLIEYPLRLVKLDRSFINKYLTNENINVFNTVVYLAKELNYEVVAEGVETLEQVGLLKKTDCIKAQGYYYYKPMEIKDVYKLEGK